MAAVEAGYDFGALALCALALGLLLAVKGLADALHSALNIGFLGVHPFAGIADTLNNTLIAWLDDAIRGVEKIAARFFSGMIDSFGLLIAIPILVYIGARDALTYMWNSALMPRVHSVTDSIRATATEARDDVKALASTVADDYVNARNYADARASHAIESAEAFTTTKVAGAVAAVRGELANAVQTLEHTIDTATDGALSTALHAVHAAELAVEGEIADAEGAAAAALAQSQALGQAALDAVKSIAVTVEDDLSTIEGGLGALGVAGLIAAIPAIATLVQSIATESGLENAECRTKVKGICGTHPSAWANLLAGAALAGVSFGLSDLVGVAKELIEEGSAVMHEFA